MSYLAIASFIGQEVLNGVSRKQEAKRQVKRSEFAKGQFLTQAVDIEQLGGLDELEFREQSEFDLASIESQFADAGVGLTGSTIDVLLASKRRLETDALKIRESTRRSVKTAREQAGQAGQEAAFARAAAKKSFFGSF